MNFKEKNITIDEAIEDLKECDAWHVSEWLEELKQYRELGTIEEIEELVNEQMC